MKGEISNPDTVEVEIVEDAEDDMVSNEFSEDTIVIEDVADDFVIDSSSEVDVSQLIEKLDVDDGVEAQQKREIHRRLEALNDKKQVEKDIDSTFNFNLDDDL